MLGLPLIWLGALLSQNQGLFMGSILVVKADPDLSLTAWHITLSLMSKLKQQGN